MKNYIYIIIVLFFLFGKENMLAQKKAPKAQKIELKRQKLDKKRQKIELKRQRKDFKDQKIELKRQKVDQKDQKIDLRLQAIDLEVPECQYTYTLQDFKADAVTDSSVGLSWLSYANEPGGYTASAEIVYGYKDFHIVNTTEYLGIANTYSTNSWTFNNLQANTEYDFYIKLICQDVEYWTKATAKTLTGCTPAPVALDTGSFLAYGASTESVRIHWKSGVNSSSPLTIAYGKAGVFDLANASTYKTITTPTNINEFYILGLEPSTAYVFYIKAECQSNDLYVGPVEATTLSDITGVNIDIEAIKATPGTSFRPIYEKKYVISGWVKEEGVNSNQQAVYTNSAIRLYTLALEGGALSDPVAIGDFYPKGNVIDGWQRIEEVFVIKTPNGGEVTPNNLIIELINSSSETTSYFDDIRIFPFNASIKSFVYDNKTKKLMAELDENNYATYYEYDKEGGLVRVKKETSKGIYTIQETRSSNAKN
ncbi:hypothetical protein [Tenacibaculum sp.]|uniref:hypothetical protein n=1 Tax=Tenacibaculum sp. TaxID=1906242 RepID=UPI003D0B5C07